MFYNVFEYNSINLIFLCNVVIMLSTVSQPNSAAVLVVTECRSCWQQLSSVAWRT